MAALQLVLARGVRLDWFSSNEILLEGLVAAIVFYVFIVHCLTARAPFLSLRLLQLHADGIAATAPATLCRFF